MFRRIKAKFKRFPSVLFLFLMPQILIPSPTSAAGNVVFSALGVTCTQHTGSNIYGHRYIAGTNGQISAINALLPVGAVSNSTFQTNFPNARYLVMADNGNLGPVTTLATFTADTMTGVNARFVGSYSITAGTKFWIVPAQVANNFPDCYAYPGNIPSASVTLTNGWRLDTTTASSWYSTTGANTASLGSANSGTILFAISIELTPPSPASVNVSLQSGGTGATYRAITTIKASASTDGKVTFYQAGKVIAGCRNVLTVSSVATCSWRPSIHGGASLTAKIIPTDSSIPQGVSPVFTAGVSTRVNKR
jgi:hypothetical protein